MARSVLRGTLAAHWMRLTVPALVLASLAALLFAQAAALHAQQTSADKYEQQIFAERDRLIAQERRRELTQRAPEADQGNKEFWKQMFELQEKYDQHVVLARLKDLSQGSPSTDVARLKETIALLTAWERSQELTGIEDSPELAKQINALKPDLLKAAKTLYDHGVKDCNASNAIENVKDIVGAERTALLIGGDDASLGNWLGDAHNCGLKAPLIVSFDSHVQIDFDLLPGRYVSDVQAHLVKLNLVQPNNEPWLVYRTEGQGFPLQYTNFHIGLMRDECSTGYGISGTLSIDARLNEDTGTVTIQLLPGVREHIRDAMISRGVCTQRSESDHYAWYWDGFVMTGGAEPLVMKLDTTVELNKRFREAHGVTATQKSTIILQRGELNPNP